MLFLFALAFSMLNHVRVECHVLLMFIYYGLTFALVLAKKVYILLYNGGIKIYWLVLILCNGVLGSGDVNNWIARVKRHSHS